MKLKIDANGNAVLQDGQPVYVHDDGKEIPFDASRAFETIKKLNDENKGHREEKEQVIAKLKAFESIDPAAARKAIDTLKSLDQKKLVDAGEVEKVKSEAVEAFKKQLEETKVSYERKLGETGAMLQERDSTIFTLMVRNKFANSKIVSEKLSIPADMVEAKFGGNYKIEDGKVFAYVDGKKVFSRKNPGEYADFEEALETMIEAYPDKDKILKGSNASGSGANGSASRQMTPDILKMSPTERMNYARANAGAK